MRILLIYPPDKHSIRTNVPKFVDDEIGIYPPLGLMYIAASILQWTDWEVELLDCNAERIDYSGLKNEIKKRRPDIVGIQAITFTLIDAAMTAKIVKEINPQISVLVGGPHANIFPYETLSLPYVDYIILGEAEFTVCKFLQAMENNGKLDAIEGVGSKINGDPVINSKQNFIDNLDGLPFPARKITNVKSYYSLLAKESPITTFLSSRGCPFECLYCDRPHLGKEFRARSAKNIVQEMNECVSMGIKEIFFYDDTFAIDRERVLEICDLITKQKLKISWDVRTHINTIDEFTLHKMAQAGCARIHLGVETASPLIQKVLRKNLDLEKVKKIFSAARSAGIKTLAYFMIGCPTETASQIEETMDFMLILKTDYVHISIATPYPHTDMYNLGLKDGVLKNDYWREFARNPNPDFSPRLWDEILSEDELLRLLKKAYKRFYLRPAYITNYLSEINGFRQLKNMASAGIKIIFS